MKRFIIAAAAAALLGGTALSTVHAQDTQAGQEEIIKKPNTNSATEAAPGQQQKSGETESANEVAPGQQKTGEADAKDAAPGQVKKQNQATGEQQQKAPGKADSDSASDNKQPSTETTGSINVNTEQKTEITQVFREVKAEPVSIDIEVNVGVTVPKTIRLRPLPPRVIEIVPAYRGYEYFVLADGRIIIVEPGTLEVVYILVG